MNLLSFYNLRKKGQILTAVFRIITTTLKIYDERRKNIKVLQNGINL